MKNFFSALKYFTVLAAAIVITTHTGNAQKVSYTDSWNKAGYNLKTSNRSGLSIGYSVTEFTLAPAEINGRSMTNVELPGYWLPNDEGAPNLPGGGRYIAIPEGATPILDIKSMRTERFQNLDIAPSPRIPWDDELDPLEYKENPEIYTRNAFYPANPVVISEVTQIRGVDVVMVGITPFQYNPVTKELIVYRDIDLDITFEGGNGQYGEERLRSRFWDPIITDAILNYDVLPKMDYGQRALNNNRDNGCEYLIIVPDGADFMTYAEQIRQFRIKQGISTEIVTLTEVGGNNVATIEAYINNVYNSWDPVPAAILIMADYGNNQNSNITAPIWDNYCVSDNIWGDVDNDDMPDFVMARMTANNAAELEIYISKFMDYEMDPPTSPDFYDHPITALGWQTERWFQICSETVGGYFKNVHGKNPVRINEVYGGNPNSDPWSTATNTSTVLGVFGPSGLGYIPSTPQELGNWSGGNATMINNALNAGAFILQHRDHGMETGWGEPSYTNSNINGLTNTELSFIFSINCLTGKYNWNSECFTEKFHRYTYNGQNSGALGLNAASEVSYSFVNDTYVWGMYDNMWPDFLPQYGPMGIEERGLLPAFGSASGKYFLQQSSWPYNTSNKEVTYNLFHHHGDAFLELYSEVPQPLTLLHGGVILAGLDQFDITADAGSTVCLTVGDQIIGLAEGTGAPLSIPITPQQVGTTVILTVTKTNYFRSEEFIQVIPADGPYCIYSGHTVNDAAGNGNGLIDYNETVSLNINIKNVGLENAENTLVVISTTDPYIDLIDDTEAYGTVAAGQTVTVSDGFTFITKEDIPDQHKIYFDVEATDGSDVWSSIFVVKANAPVINMNHLTINDSENGNGNGKLDPGETVTMTINYTNTGHAIAYGVDSYLEGQSGFVEVLNPNQHFNFISFFGVFNKSFDVVIDADAPEGIVVNFVNEVTMGSFMDSRVYPKKISEKIEDFETGNFNKFDWVSAGNLPWTVTSQYPYQGNFSAKSGVIGANETTEIKITYNVMTPDSIAFIRKISSEDNDKLQFYIGNTLIQEWFGMMSWSREAYPVQPGNHTFRWVYTKNGSTNGGADCAWLDNIEFPPPMVLTIWAGPNEEICTGDNFMVEEAYGTAYATAEWTTAGTGSFNNTTVIHPIYTPSDDDLANGSVTLTLTLWDGSGYSVTDDMVLTFNEGPEAPPTPEGPDYVDLFTVTTSDYTTQGIPGISNYIWFIDPTAAGSIEEFGTFATVTWNPDFLGIATITVAGINNCGQGELSEDFEVTVDNTVGLKETVIEGLSLDVYPNPSDGNFNVILSSRDSKRIDLRVTNILGKTVYERVFTIEGLSRQTIDLQSLPNGVYFMVIENAGNFVSRKVIKK